MNQRILSILVDNSSGVLTRIAGLFSRRGYNIDSITAGVTADPRFTRITIVTSGDDLTLDQITNQVAKQVYVRDVKILDPANSVSRELMLAQNDYEDWKASEQERLAEVRAQLEKDTEEAERLKALVGDSYIN